MAINTPAEQACTCGHSIHRHVLANMGLPRCVDCWECKGFKEVQRGSK